MGKTATTVSASLAYTASAGDTITKIYAPAAATLASVEFGQNQNPYNVPQGDIPLIEEDVFDFRPISHVSVEENWDYSLQKF